MTEQAEYTADVLIIGAGIAGLLAAQQLEQAGLSVTVIDKGRSVGGRLATRRIGPGLADHGAQFFTAREAAFQQMVDRWMEQDLVYVWSNGFSDGSLIEPTYTGNPRYAVHGGMNALAQALARDLHDVRVNVRIVTATFDQQGWIFQDDEGGIYTSRGLIITAPVPQALEILDAGATSMTDEEFSVLASLTYAQCLTGLFWVEGRFTLPRPGAVQRRNTNITWIGDNLQKGISPDARLITVQAGELYSRQMWNAPDERVLKAMMTYLRPYMDDDVVVKESQLKRWRYSRPLVTHPERTFALDTGEGNPPVVFAGDAFGGPRVEGAALSGLAAGDRMASMLVQNSVDAR